MFTLDESDSSSVSLDEVKAIVHGTEIQGIYLNEIVLPSVGFVPKSASVAVHRKVPEFSTNDDDLLMVKFGHEITFRGSEDEETQEALKLDVAHLLVLRLTQPVTATPAALLAYADTNAYFMVYPYLRQVVTEITSQVGMEPVVLGYLRRSDTAFQRRPATES